MYITLFIVAIPVNCTSEFRELFKATTYTFHLKLLNLQHRQVEVIRFYGFTRKKDLMLIFISVS